jgi:hypothetical protein
MTTILPALSLFIGLKYYELISISDPLTPNHKMMLYGILFLIAILSNIFTLYVYLNGNIEVLKNIQLWVYTIMCWCLFIVIWDFIFNCDTFKYIYVICLSKW